MKKGILQSHASLITFFNQLMDLLAIPFLLWLCIQFLDYQFSDISLYTGGLVAAISFQFMANVRGQYFSMRGEKVSFEIIKCLKYWLVAFAISSLVIFFINHEISSRDGTLFIWFTLTSLHFILSRLFIRFSLWALRKRGYNQRNVVIVGAGEMGVKLANSISKSPELGLKVTAFYDDDKSGLIATNQGKIEIAGNLKDLINDVKLVKIDRIYITLSMRHMTLIKQLTNELADTTCSVIFVPDMFSFDLLNSRMSHLNGIPTISIYDTPMEGANRLVKRIEDIVLSTIILLLISPVILVISIMIKATSPGPVFFKQNRYGIDGKAIKVWKFRSMTVMDNGADVVQAKKGDARITPLGAVLRKTSLDELPQFINVLQGGMSIVGPRPHAIAHNEEYRKLIDGYMLRHKVKPGITGWAQINGWRGETDTLEKMEKRVEFDLHYISHWTLLWDLKIIFLTIFKGFINKNAY